MIPLNRRVLLLSLAAACLKPALAQTDDDELLKSGRAEIAALESRVGGRLGVYVVDPAKHRELAHRADDRFPMCSTFKALAAAALLARVDAGGERLDRRIDYSEADLLSYAPVTREHVAQGMTLGELCAAAIDYSDNTAANLMLAALGGPQALTHYLEGIGDAVTRLDRNEPTLNEATPGDVRDTSSPRAFAQDLAALISGDKLSVSSRAQLEAWMVDDKVGDQRLRAGLPADWKIGDKTGTGDHGTANAVAILRPPGRGPLFAGVFLTETELPPEGRNGVHRDVAKIIARTM